VLTQKARGITRSKIHHTILSIKLVLLEVASLIGFIYFLVAAVRGEIHW